MLGGLHLPQDGQPPGEQLPLAEYKPMAVEQLKQEMTPEELQKFLAMKLSVLVEMIGERRLALLDRLIDRRKIKFKWWMRIGFAIQGLKIACCAAIFACLMFFRFYTVQYMFDASWHPGGGQDLIEFFIFDGILLLSFIIILAIISEGLLLGLGILRQHPNPLAIAFAANSVFVLAIILMGCFTGGTAINVEPISRHLFGHSFSLDNENVLFLYKYQRKYGTGEQTWKMTNQMKWLYDCYNDNKQLGCSVPRTCCEKGSCTGQVSELDFNLIITAGKAENDVQVASLAPTFQKLPGNVIQKGCWNVLRNEMSFLLMIVGIAVFILAILHLLLTVLVIAGIIYHSAMGCIDPHLLTLRPATKTPLVMFFMWLDGLLLPDDATLTDFSIIEYLKNLDVDERFAEVED